MIHEQTLAEASQASEMNKGKAALAKGANKVRVAAALTKSGATPKAKAAAAKLNKADI
jgi:hypothetical protein